MFSDTDGFMSAEEMDALKKTRTSFGLSGNQFVSTTF